MKLPIFNRKPDNSGTPEGVFGKIRVRVREFFSPEPQKERVLRHEDFMPAGDLYYASVSARYKIAQRILLTFLVFFLLFSIITNFNEITYDNFFYLMKDFGNAINTEGSNFETLSYGGSHNQRFALFRGGLAVISPTTGVSAFTATGRRTLTSPASFSMPHAISSDKYLLVYDMGKPVFSVYNSFSRIYTETLDYPVTNAVFADSDTFVIATRSADYKTLINVYSRNFNVARSIWRDLYLFGLDVDKANDLIAFAYYNAGDGTGNTVLALHRFSTLEKIAEIGMPGQFPLEISFLDGKKLSVVTDNAFFIFDSSLEENEALYFAGKNVTGTCAGDYGVAFSYTTGEARDDINTIFVFDKNGVMMYNDIVNFRVREMVLGDRCIFINSDMEI